MAQPGSAALRSSPCRFFVRPLQCTKRLSLLLPHRRTLEGSANHHRLAEVQPPTSPHHRHGPAGPGKGRSAPPQAVAIDGRYISAAASALAVGLLTLLGIYLFGLGGGILTGLLLASHPLLFELSHYLKEDCCLLLGVTAFFAALAVYEHLRTLIAATMLGAACGLATSGKYIGIITLVVALPTLLIYARSLSISQRCQQVGLLLAGLWRSLSHPEFPGTQGSRAYPARPPARRSHHG